MTLYQHGVDRDIDLDSGLLVARVLAGRPGGRRTRRPPTRAMARGPSGRRCTRPRAWWSPSSASRSATPSPSCARTPTPTTRASGARPGPWLRLSSPSARPRTRRSSRHESTSVTDVLATANAAMVGRESDITGGLAALLSGVVAALPARRGRGARRRRRAPSSCSPPPTTGWPTSRPTRPRSTTGPVSTPFAPGVEVHAVGVDDLESPAGRWPGTGHRRGRSPGRCRLLPLRWQGSVFGALNVFREEEAGFAAPAGRAPRPRRRRHPGHPEQPAGPRSASSVACTRRSRSALSSSWAKGALSHVLVGRHGERPSTPCWPWPTKRASRW